MSVTYISFGWRYTLSFEYMSVTYISFGWRYTLSFEYMSVTYISFGWRYTLSFEYMSVTYISFGWRYTELYQPNLSLFHFVWASLTPSFLVKHQTIDELCVFNGPTTKLQNIKIIRM
jgi:hypothetical protein